MARTVAAWARLVEDGLVKTRADAERWILSGKVRAGPTPVTSAGQRIDADAQISVKGLDQPYVAKGGLKLQGALDAFGIDVAGCVCIDAGASTGGFTDCLIKRGAARVYAVDVGYGQLAGSLRNHPAVVNLERTNIGDARLLTLSPRPVLGTVDLSYLSLRRAVPQFAEILGGRGRLLCLVKPLFEVDDPVARRSGRLAAGAYAPLLMQLEGALAGAGYATQGITHSPVTGNGGTLEFFFNLALDGGSGLPREALAGQAEAAAAAAAALTAYHKR